jgi:thymidine kinase
MTRQPTIRDPGRLEVICGPMFAGKTSELIRRLGAAASQDLITIAIKPFTDTRYITRSGTTGLATHDGKRIDASAVHDASEIGGVVKAAAVIAIAEAHFFGQSLVDPVLALVRSGRRIIVAGVERNHRGEPFDPFPRLLCEADEVVKLSGPCAVCGRPAIHSQRMAPGEEHIVVGGPELYQARCRVCFSPL